MAKLVILTILLVIFVYPIYYIFLQSPPLLPDIELDTWWGPKERGGVESEIVPYKVSFSNETVSNLKERLKNHRSFAPPLEGSAFTYGFNSKELVKFLDYWATGYDFVKREKFFNQYQQYRTNVQGLDIHFVRVTPKAPLGVETLPILLLHGWPGSHREFFEAVPYLTAYSKDRDFVLELIIPSLPGFGYSSASVRPGLGTNEVAVVLRNLMQRLGFKQFYIQGGDLGAIIGSAMATFFPREVLGFHNNFAYVMSSLRAKLLELAGSIFPSLIVEPRLADRMYPLSTHLADLLEESGYFHIQATKPDTIGVALTDSPAGLLAYILEKFSTGTDKSYRGREDGGLSVFPKDHLIDNIMVYWTGKCMTTAMRIYKESFNKGLGFSARVNIIPTPVPTWALQAKHEIFYQPPFILRLKYPNLVDVTVLDERGHFIAMEMPQVFAEDVLKAVHSFRRLGRVKTEL